MKQPVEIEVRSEEVQDLPGKIPSWITRNGSIMIVFLLLILLTGSWFFKYPDIISAPVVVTMPATGTDHLLGKVRLNIQGAGKVLKGQNVNLKFASYPYLEYGLVKGVVSRVSRIPANDSYAVEVELPAQLISTYGKKLEFEQELQGTAEIITEDQRLILRILHPVRALFSERFSK